MKWLINTALHHRTYDMLYESNSLWWYSHLYRYDEIPMQESSNLVLLREGFALIPHNGNAKKFSELHDQILGFHKELVYLKYSSPTHVQQKYNYTINMLDELMDTFHQFGEKQIRKGR